MFDKIVRAFNRPGVTQAVALDISKSFDRVWHAGLLHKLKSYGISTSKTNLSLMGFQHPTHSVDIVDGIVEIALSLRCISHLITIFVCGLLPCDSNWSVNRGYIDEINNYLCCKSKLNGISFINHNDWTFQDDLLNRICSMLINYILLKKETLS